MSRRYFAHKKKKDPNLIRIIFLICLLAGAGYGVVRLVGWIGSAEYVGAGGTPVEARQEEGLRDAQNRLEAGDDDAAREIARAVLEEEADSDTAREATEMLVEIELDRKNPAEALRIIEAYRQEHPEAAGHPDLDLRYARVLEDSGSYAEAAEVFARVRDRAPAAYRAEALNGIARQQFRDGEKVAARNLYQEAVKVAEWEGDTWNDALDGLGDLNVELIFSPQETPESKVYTIESGDSLTTIGIKLNTTQGLLTRANGIDDPSRIRPGQRLKYTPKDFRVLIERSTCRLFLLDNDGIFKRYHVGLGMPGYETTIGKYTIGSKQKDPVWFKPGSDPVPAGDPENELGTRWMPLVPAEEGLPTDLGIHGTIAPETIGQYKSHGCPRMRTPEVEELYDLIVRSTPVEIVDTIDWSLYRGAPSSGTVLS
jgi:lipoprotein-anchoring transpeptidase ErfK/SrfK/plasmid stability protein